MDIYYKKIRSCKNYNNLIICILIDCMYLNIVYDL